MDGYGEAANATQLPLATAAAAAVASAGVTINGTFPPSPPPPPKPGPPLDYVGYVFVPIFLVLGVTGNVLTIVVMRSKLFRKFPASYVLICLALSDTVLNVLLPFNKRWVRALLGTDIRSYTQPGCRAFFWAFRTAKMTSSWLVVLICIERFIAVCFPIKAAALNRKKHAVVCIALIYLLIGAYNGVWTTYADYLVGGVCRPNEQPPGLVRTNRTFLIVGLSIYSFVPCVILVSLTLCIIASLHSARRQRRSMIGHAESYQDMTARTTAMLLCVIVAFVVLVLPIACAHLVSYVKRQPIFESTALSIVVFREVAQLLEHMNYSINFVLYVVACPSFRNHLPAALCCGGCGAGKDRSSLNQLALQDSNDSDKSRSSAVASRRSSAASVQVHQVSKH